MNFTPPDKLVDAQGRPYFLWDVDMTIDQFRERLAEGGPDETGRLIGKMTRQAKPDDVFQFVRVARIRREWASIEPHLGDKREFWTWILAKWKELGVA